MALFLKALGGRVEELHGHGVRIRFIGDRSAFAADLQDGMAEAESLTGANNRMTVVIAGELWRAVGYCPTPPG